MIYHFLRLVVVFCFGFSFVAKGASSKIESEADMRIVSLAPNLTEIVFALGLGDKLVGNTLQCDFPPEAKKIAKIGEMTLPNIELIIALKPSIVLATEGNDRGVLEKLKKFNIRVFESHIKSVNDLPKMLKSLGEVLHKSSAGEALAKTTSSALQKLKDKGTERKKHPKKFLLALQFSPVFSVTNATWLGDLLAQAGLKNIVPAGKINYPQLANEFIIAQNPDLIFFNATSAKSNNEKVDYEEVKANVEKLLGRKTLLPTIVIFPADILVRPGPRLAEGIDFLLNSKEFN